MDEEETELIELIEGSEESSDQLSEELIILFQDIVDCLKSSGKFDDLFYIHMMTESVSEDFTSHTYRRRKSIIDDIYISELVFYKNSFIVKIPEQFGVMIFNIYEEENRVEQSYVQTTTTKLEVFDGGLRMCNSDVDLIEKVVEWCEKINPDYW